MTLTSDDVDSVLNSFRRVSAPTGIDVLDQLVNACRTVVDHDRFLLEHSASERAICHRLAVYLEQGLRDAGYDWDVDCEYNRVGAVDIEDRVKRLFRRCPEMRADNVAPDVIVHRRGRPMNELVVEAKLLSTLTVSDIAKDTCKLDAFMADPELGYHEAAFVLIVNGANPDILIYRRSVDSEPAPTRGDVVGHR